MPRYLGQHFLINKKKIQQIIDALDLKSGDMVIEIGPGHGELTLELRIQNTELRIIAVEKDPKLAFSVQRLGGSKNLKVITGDVLKILPQITKRYPLNAKPYKIVGNIPYYITGHLLRIIGELKHKPSLIALTIQKEVAERICAKAPKMNLLAASVQFWAEPEIIDYIPKKDFRPEPEVDSAIIKLVIKKLSNYEIVQSPNYYKTIKILFKQPRKTILNNLALSIKHRALGIRKEEIIEKLKKLEINPDHRPQDLNLEQIQKLSK